MPVSYSINDLSFKYNSEHDKSAFMLGPLSFEIPKGETTFICGRSGSGKSTLLAILGLLRTEFEGDLVIDEMSSEELRKDSHVLYKYRLENIGFALQKGRLLPYLTVRENSEFILEYLKYSPEEISEKSSNVFGKLFKVEKEEEEKSYHRVIESYPEDISGGQYQRAALARALINSPSIILADEPTGNLDVNTGEKAMELLKDYLKEKADATVVIVSHDLEYARRYGDKIVILKKGLISAIIHKINETDWKVENGSVLRSSEDLNQYLNSKIKDDE